MKNKYAYRSRISEAKIRQLVKLFSVDLTASQIAELSGVNIVPRLLSRELYGDELTLRASFTRMGGEAMMVLSIWGIKNTSAFNTLITNLPTNTRISMG